jgi:hypothetical protein
VHVECAKCARKSDVAVPIERATNTDAIAAQVQHLQRQERHEVGDERGSPDSNDGMEANTHALQ